MGCLNRISIGKNITLGIIFHLLSACEERESLAPVVESNWRALHSNETRHRVAPGETLYAIAFRYDQDYRQLANINHIPSPYVLSVGQIIDLKSHRSALPPVRQRQTQRFSPSVVSPSNRRTFPSGGGSWSWPARGAILASFVPQLGQKGIDIAGHKGQTIYAASNGTVAYAGDGLAGYGNLILIKHDYQYLSAYAYNARNLVRVGQHVHKGQAIASMGMNTRHRYAVHFEIRRAGQPVNPTNYLR